MANKKLKAFEAIVLHHENSGKDTETKILIHLTMMLAKDEKSAGNQMVKDVVIKHNDVDLDDVEIIVRPF